MNKTAIKKFAVESRQKLIKSTIEKLEELGITDKEVVELVELGGVYSVKAQTLTESQKKNRDIIIQKIQEKSYEPFVEEVAYTWFNRMIAIRYMEVNDYLPFRTRVLSSEIQGKVDPDIITEIADHIEELELNPDKVIELKEKNKQEELFKYVFIKVCNYLGQFLPVMFEQIEDYSELLLPSVMISNGSVIKDMIELVPEEDWENEVEIIGWLYQYYISEKKDQVFADLKKNKKITKENIPAATQLFTPEWIVKYMVENSLGRLWLEGHPNEELKSKWKYYLAEAEQEETVQLQLAKMKKESEILTPEDLTIIDPAMGSGHILVYAFDVLYQIYQSEGYSEKDIPRLILEKNIHGLDIDDRAGQLAYFALMMKARSYSRRFLKEIRNLPINLNVFAIVESNIFNVQDIECFSSNKPILKEEFNKLVDEFLNAKEYGALLNVRTINIEVIIQRLKEMDYNSSLLDYNFVERVKKYTIKLLDQYNIFKKTYHICITNPPYMGNGGMTNTLQAFAKKNYVNSKNDLSTMFMERAFDYVNEHGFISMINIPTWMFLNSYANLRLNILNHRICSLIYLGRGIFGSDFGTVAFVFNKKYIESYCGQYKKLFERSSLVESIERKESKYLECDNIHFNQDNFKIIQGYPIAFWSSKDMVNIFRDSKKLNDFVEAKVGLQTGDNNRFLRKWNEVDRNRICLNFNNDVLVSQYKWIPYNKGGEFRKWYGNNEYIVNWENDGFEIKNFKSSDGKLRSRPQNIQFYFKKCLTWSKVTIGGFSVRFIPEGFIFDVAGCSIFIDENTDYFLGLLNSKVISRVLTFLSPTVNYEVGNILSLPIIISDREKIELIERVVRELVLISKQDWDSFELSWDFKSHPFIRYSSISVENSLEGWLRYSTQQFNHLKLNEEELNRIFIEIYGLQKELTPEVEEKDITIRKADRDREMKSFISYAVGCMMGRYSLDEEGLVFAGGKFDESKYQTFKANKDGIILISDTEYFEDDLLNRFVEFLKVVYGEETLEENLNFIADTECFKRKATESARDCLRRYFLKGFMEDHLKVYQKRPIYWMFDSGKQNGFKALIYLHRYNEDMVAKVRTDYLHPLQRKYEAELERLDHLINFENISAAEKGKAKKRQEQIHKQLDECTQYDVLLAHVAHQRIALDLDDGVKVNYQKFQNIELTRDDTSKVKKGDLLYKVKM